MTYADTQVFLMFHDALASLEGDEAEKFYLEHQDMFVVDECGNWVGPVANENGWTP